jgi:ferredoxin, 2Fe-2S
MIEVTFINADGTKHIIAAAEGVSAMEAAVSNNVPDIDGDCGGHAACATCHVFVEMDWLDRTGRADSVTELPLLELAEGVMDNSRLACQIKLNETLDGLVLHLPRGQF